jgi:UDP-GlcNAc:undecaprenyl-phosphate GlcNAc-1-phosphate transferase
VELAALIIALAAAIVALVFTPLVRKLALKVGFVDRPGERKIHDREIAYGGGFAVALAMVAVGTAALFITRDMGFGAARDDLAPPEFLVLGLGSLGALLLGWYDDKVKLSPYAKLAGQFVLAIGAVAGGVRITALVGDTWVMKSVTVLWIVLITNSFNLLDNMDGLCAGTGAIAASVLAIVAMGSGQWALTLALMALAGACLGFMRYNRAPASIFLGDAGSLFIGFLMACFTVLVTYYHYKGGSHLAVGIPILVLAIPLYDTLSVILIRLKERRPIMRGDTSHFSHRLVDLGMTRGQAVATIHLACLAIGLPATVLTQLSESSGFLILGQAALVLTIVALLERAGRNRAKANGENGFWSVAEKKPEPKREEAETK